MKPIPQPKDQRNDAARQILQEQAMRSNPRQFRDALTRAGSATYGIETKVKQWNRWDK